MKQKAVQIATDNLNRIDNIITHLDVLKIEVNEHFSKGTMTAGKRAAKKMDDIIDVMVRTRDELRYSAKWRRRPGNTQAKYVSEEGNSYFSSRHTLKEMAMPFHDFFVVNNEIIEFLTILDNRLAKITLDFKIELGYFTSYRKGSKQSLYNHSIGRAVDISIPQIDNNIALELIYDAIKESGMAFHVYHNDKYFHICRQKSSDYCRYKYSSGKSNCATHANLNIRPPAF